MHLSALKKIKLDVVDLLSRFSPLSFEELQGILTDTSEASIALALEALEKEEKITTNKSSHFILTINS